MMMTIMTERPASGKSTLEALCDNALYKLTLTLTNMAKTEDMDNESVGCAADNAAAYAAVCKSCSDLGLLGKKLTKYQ